MRREPTEQEIADMCTFPGDDYLGQIETMLADGVLFNPGPDFNFQVKERT